LTWLTEFIVEIIAFDRGDSIVPSLLFFVFLDKFEEKRRYQLYTISCQYPGFLEKFKSKPFCTSYLSIFLFGKCMS
jgi:hypothetical protein